jgi:hypothetical protein
MIVHDFSMNLYKLGNSADYQQRNQLTELRAMELSIGIQQTMAARQENKLI